MIQEQYVSFETAKVLKEKGFDEWCQMGYNGEGKLLPFINMENSRLLPEYPCKASAPTQSLVMRWLREVHNIDVTPMFYEVRQCYVYRISVNGKFNKDDIDGFISYEEACESAIKYCLERLI